MSIALSINQKYNLRPVIIAILLCLVAGLFLLIAILTGFVLYHEVYGLVYPKVEAAGVNIGGMTKEQAVLALDEIWRLDNRLLIQSDQQVWQDTTFSFGIWLDAEATVEEAYQIGRGAKAGVECSNVIFQKSVSVQPVVRVDLDMARKRLADVAFLIDDPTTENQIRFVEDRWEIVAKSDSKSLNIHKTLLDIASRPDLILMTGILTLSIDEGDVVPLVISNAEQDALSLLNSALKIRAYDPVGDEYFEQTFNPEKTSRWVSVENLDSVSDIQIDWGTLNSDLNIWAGSLPNGYEIDSIRNPDEMIRQWKAGKAVTVLLRRFPTKYVVQSGDTLLSIASYTEIPYWRILQENPGVSEDNLTAGMEFAIPSKNDLLPLPVILGKRIVINIPQQRMRIYENKDMIDEFVISTGISRSPTAAGVFQVQTHELNAYASIWDLYMPHFLGIYEAAPDFMNGIHGLPTLSSGQRLWANVLGTPASYGCIILDLDDAEFLYDWAENGVVVEIQS